MEMEISKNCQINKQTTIHSFTHAFTLSLTHAEVHEYLQLIKINYKKVTQYFI